MTNRGEVIGLFLSEEIKSDNFESVIFEIRNQNGLVIIPHPFDELRNSALHPAKEDIKLMDGVEVFNSRCLSQKYNINAAAFATKYNLVVTAGSDAHFSNEIGNGGIVTEDENIMEAIAKNQITTFGKRSLLVNHVLTKTLKLIRNDETIISSISVTDIFFDVYLGKWNYRAIPKVKTWSYFLTIP